MQPYPQHQPQPAPVPPPIAPNQPPALPPGTLLFNRYLIQGYISGGGFGHIYKALDTTLGYRRAIKEAFYQDPNTRRQFHLEAEFLLNARHPNLVRGYLVFEQMGHLYLVMDYVDGHTIEEIAIDHIRRTGWTLPEARILEWMIPICGALHALHSSPVPIIHRDVKPANVKVTRRGIPILIDLGLAKLFARGTQTIGAALAFTPGYAPPEQYRASGATDARTDVYGMGASLYYLLTGYQPTEAPARLGAQAIPQLRQLNPAVSRLTEAAVLRAMELDPMQRQQSALQLDHDLRAALAALRQRPQPASEIPAGGQAASVTCARCSAGNPAIARHCMSCGAPLRESTANAANAANAASGNGVQPPQPATASAQEDASPTSTASSTARPTPLPDWLVSTLQGEPGAFAPALPAPPDAGEQADQPDLPDQLDQLDREFAQSEHHAAGGIPIPPHVSARPLFVEAPYVAAARPADAASSPAPPPATPPATPADNVPAAQPSYTPAPPRPDAPHAPRWRPASLAAFVARHSSTLRWQRALPSLRRWHAETLSAAPPLDDNEVRSGLAAVLALVLAIATLAAVQWRWSLLAALPALALAHWCLANRKAPPVPEARWIATLALVITYTWLVLVTIGTIVLLLHPHH